MTEARQEILKIVLAELDARIACDAAQIDPDKPLVDYGISSLELVEVILSIDGVMPSPVELYDLSFQDFETVNRIVGTFSG